MKKVNVAIVGLGFGCEFIPIYNAYKNTECVALCRRNNEELNKTADIYGIEKRYTDYYDLLDDDEIDAVHINTPINAHAWMSIEALKKGKHVASTVPMAINVDECLEIADLQKQTNKVYMMMETAVYTREYLYVLELYRKGEMGRLQFLRGAHQQNMGLMGWPDYWYGFPPMYYATHAISPIADLVDKRINSVRCYGSGRIQEEYIDKYNSPYAVESSQLEFKDSDITCEVTRSLFNTIRQYRESFDVYASKLSFEWEQIAKDSPVLYSGHEDFKRIKIPDTDIMLPKEISKFALENQIEDEGHVSFVQGAGHGGSHPHLVHEFISAILENRVSHIDAEKAANWTIAGILSHESAMNDGKKIILPK